jgi:hypothetical protein
MPDCHPLQDYARKQVQLEPGADKGVAAMLTCASWVLQRLPGQVVEQQRSALVQALRDARELVVEVRCSPPAVRVRDAGKVLVEIPANG